MQCNIKLLISILLLILLACMLNNTKLEGYKTTSKYSNIPDYSSNNLWDNLSVGKTNTDCYSLSPDKCTNFSNCGLCYRLGVPKCIPGDAKGALFEEKCDKWKYNNFYDRKFVNEQVCRKVLPWSYRYPEYEYANLQRPF